MFIKLTKLDGSPLWLNASFVVTIEPRRGGGSVVVPIGDGFDYDVKESPERVLWLLGDPAGKAEPRQQEPRQKAEPAPEVIEAVKALAEATATGEAGGTGETSETGGTSGTGETTAEVIAVPPTSDGLAPTPADVSPEDEPAEPVPEEKPVKRGRGRTRKTAAAKAQPEADKKGADEPKPDKPAKRAEELTDDEIGRLRKLAPRSLRKFANTLSSQFGVADAEAAVKLLVARDLLQVEQERIIWK